MTRPILLAALLATGLYVPVWGQHEHVSPAATPAAVPKIYLDKSPRIVEYQLKRLTNEQLLLVERRSDDPKYAPVHRAILTREGMSRGYREEALAALVKLSDSDAVTQLSETLAAIDAGNAAGQRMVRSLAPLLLERPSSELAGQAAALQALAARPEAELAAVGYAALLAAGQDSQAWTTAQQQQRLAELLAGIRLITSDEVRNRQHAAVTRLLDAASDDALGRAALAALATFTVDRRQTFQRAAELVQRPQLQAAAIKALLSVPAAERDSQTSRQLIDWLVAFAEQTPPAERTSDSFLDAMELVDQLLAAAPSEVARRYRGRLRETVVRVVRIHAVEEEMRYDIPYFAVEAGRPVQVVLINDDLMPHNLVFTAPGALQEVAEAGLAIGPNGGLDGKQYVPHSEKVLQATDMVPAREQAVLTFEAPTQPGEYPYVCTFPRHWMRMYGVMIVVDDLDAWQKNPTTPTDPIGSNRHFVQSWTLDDFQSDLPAGLRGRLPRIGEKLFVEATCAQCHKLGSVGVGNVGPELSQVFQRWKQDPAAVLREILDPSHHIDDKYAVHILITVDGETVSGQVVGDTPQSLAILENPEAQQPRSFAKADIEEMQKTANSMMPKGLLDRYSKDEVLEILAFIQGAQQ